MKGELTSLLKRKIRKYVSGVWQQEGDDKIYYVFNIYYPNTNEVACAYFASADTDKDIINKYSFILDLRTNKFSRTDKRTSI